MYFYVSSLLAKQKTIQTWYIGAHTPIDLISFFEKIWPESRWAQKTAVSREFYAYLLDCIVLLMFIIYRQYCKIWFYLKWYSIFFQFIFFEKKNTMGEH